jgi:hypothetical protein
MIRVYTSKQAQRAHLLPEYGQGPNSHTPALCGRTPSWFGYWMGTGSWAESEHVKALQLCRQCERVASQNVSAEVQDDQAN